MNSGESTDERSGIQGLFTDPMAKVLDFLLTFEGFYYSKEEIARNSEIGSEIFYALFGKLEYYDIVKERRDTEKITLYTLNTKSLIVKALKKIQHEIMFYDAATIAREQTERGIEILPEKGKIKAKA
jgi:hypothetical protein